MLVEIDPRDYETSVASSQRRFGGGAESSRMQSQAQVKVSEAKVAQAQAAVMAAEAENQRAADDLKRYQSVESRAVSKSAFDLAQAQARSADGRFGGRAQPGQSRSTGEEALSKAAVETAEGRRATGRSQSFNKPN